MENASLPCIVRHAGRQFPVDCRVANLNLSGNSNHLASWPCCVSIEPRLPILCHRATLACWLACQDCRFVGGMLGWEVAPTVSAAVPLSPVRDGGKSAAALRLRQSSCIARQRFARLKHFWNKLTVLDTNRPSLGSWLEVAQRPRPWGIGCRVCREYRSTTGKDLSVKLAWAAFGIRGAHMNTQTIHRHMMTKHHIAAMMQITGGSGQSPIGSPPLADFLVVLHDSRQGLAHASNKTVGHRHKLSCMRWCSAVAIPRTSQRQKTCLETSVLSLRQLSCLCRDRKLVSETTFPSQRQLFWLQRQTNVSQRQLFCLRDKILVSVDLL